jgi:hypothetical protein
MEEREQKKKKIQKKKTCIPKRHPFIALITHYICATNTPKKCLECCIALHCPFCSQSQNFHLTLFVNAILCATAAAVKVTPLGTGNNGQVQDLPCHKQHKKVSKKIKNY